MTPVVVRLGDLSAILLSADEPQADAHWRALAAAFPRAIRVHGLQASWSTIRRAAALADTDRFLVVRGDTPIDPALAEHVIDDELIEFAGGARLADAQRGQRPLLCRRRDPLLLAARSPGGGCRRRPARDRPAPLVRDQPSERHARHAFRAGFREAVAHGLVGGRAPGRPRLKPAAAREPQAPAGRGDRRRRSGQRSPVPRWRPARLQDPSSISSIEQYVILTSSCGSKTNTTTTPRQYPGPEAPPSLRVPYSDVCENVIVAQ